MSARNQWGISLPHGDYEWEERLLATTRTQYRDATENAQRREVLLVDAKGAPLIIREPRKLGFRNLGPGSL
jgi:hypothetical protein